MKSRLNTRKTNAFKSVALTMVAGTLGAWGSSPAAAAEPVVSPTPSRPNIVVVLADDFGFGDARCFDPQFSKIPTPNIDRLAAQGMSFTDAHSPSAVCSPTRYGILTGRYAWRTRLQNGVLKMWEPALIAPDRLTLPGMLKQQGYHSAAIGKWHLGIGWPRKDGQLALDQPVSDAPTTRGFDSYFGTDVPNYPPFAFLENDRLTQAPTDIFDSGGKDQQRAKELVVRNGGAMAPGWRFDQILPTITDKAVAYIEQQAKQKEPFFLYFALTTPHEPIAPSEQFRGKSGISPVADLIMESDWALGRTMEALERNGLAENTILIFTTDNGHCKYTGLEPFRKAGHRVSGPYRGYKSDIWEGGHRVPFVARWPGVTQSGSRCEQTICLTDLMATCAAITGGSLPETAGEDSVSFLHLLQGRTDRPARTAVVLHSAAGQFALREGNWLLALGPDNDLAKAATTQPAASIPPVQLYDLAADPAETTNRWDKEPQRVAAMTASLQKIVAEGRSTPGTPQKNDVPIDLWKTGQTTASPNPVTSLAPASPAIITLHE